MFKYIKRYSGSEGVIFREEDLFTVRIPLLQDAHLPDTVLNEAEVSDDTMTVGETVGETVRGILQAIEKNPNVTRVELQRIVGLSVRGVEWNLARLKERGVIERLGSTKKGYWRVVKK